MSTLVAKSRYVMVSDVWFDSAMIHIRLLDGRVISAPLEWFPKLRDATDEQRTNWRLIGKGIGIHWEDIDEDVSVENLLKEDHTIWMMAVCLIAMNCYASYKIKERQKIAYNLHQTL